MIVDVCLSDYLHEQGILARLDLGTIKHEGVRNAPLMDKVVQGLSNSRSIILGHVISGNKTGLVGVDLGRLVPMK